MQGVYWAHVMGSSRSPRLLQKSKATPGPALKASRFWAAGVGEHITRAQKSWEPEKPCRVLRRFAEENRRRKGRARPEVFDFLGFTHYCGETRDGRFLLCQKTQRKRMIRKLKELRQEMRRRMHQRLRDQHRWLAAVLRGHYAYFGIPGNSTCLGRFRLQVMKAWRRVLLRRSQRPKLSWERFNAILKVFPIPIGHVRDWRHQMA